MVNMQTSPVTGAVVIQTEIEPSPLVRVLVNGETIYEEQRVTVSTINDYKRMMADPNELITEDFQFYHVSPDNVPRGMRGFCGRTWQWKDKEDNVHQSSNLWYNGKMPECLQSFATPNAFGLTNI